MFLSVGEDEGGEDFTGDARSDGSNIKGYRLRFETCGSSQQAIDERIQASPGIDILQIAMFIKVLILTSDNESHNQHGH